MKSIKHTFSLATMSVLGLAVAAAPVTGQSGSGERKHEQAQQQKHQSERTELRFVPHDTIVGAAVVSTTEGGEAKSLGSVSDLVLDATSGTLSSAIIASGGTLGVGKKQTSIEWRSLVWDAEHSRFTLVMSPEALEKLPSFDPDRLNLVDRDQSGGGGGKDDGTDGRGADGAKRLVSGTRDPRGTSHVLASALSDRDVLARLEKIGTIDTLFVEPTHGSVTFLSVSSGGVLGIGETNRVIPWAALQIVKPVDKDALQLQLDKAPKDLEVAPKLGDEGADVNNAAFRHKVYAFYGVEHPAFDRAKASSSDGRSVTPRRQDRDPQ